jgi:hypothetical protein
LEKSPPMFFGQSNLATILSGGAKPPAPATPTPEPATTPMVASEKLKAVMGGEDKPKKKEYDWAGEMRQNATKTVRFDNLPANEIVKRVSAKTGLPANLLFSSAYIEGMNKAIVDPDGVSEAYLNAKVSGDFPVDGFYNYGVDRFGERYQELKKYLPEGFEQRFLPYKAKNEKGETVTTAAFRTNEDALMAKAAFIRAERDRVEALAKTKGVQLDDQARNYFTLAAYNGGYGNAQIMMDEYAKAKDKKAFIEKGLTSRGGVHKNIAPRMANMATADEFLK